MSRADSNARQAAPEGSRPLPVPVRRVKKRDGRFVPFDPGRIARAVARAQAAVGDDDPLFAAEVAEVVALALAARHGRIRAGAEGAAAEPGVPGIEEIQDLVENALIEMGRAPVAKAFILYRDRRGRTREALRVHTDPASRPDGRGPLVRDRDGPSGWSRGRIVAALMDEADVARDVAEEVAARVEHRVFDARLRRVSTSLLRELVDNELFAMGLASALKRQEPVSIPRHDLRRILAGARSEHAGPEAGVEAEISADILQRFALEDVLEERLADQHRGGDLFVEDVARPHLSLTRALPADLFLRGAISSHSAFELLADIAPLARTTGHAIVLEDTGPLLAALARGPRAGALVRDFLRSMGALAEASGTRVDLAPPGGRSPGLVARLVDELATLVQERVRVPRLYLTFDDTDGADEDALTLLLQRQVVVPVWHASDERWAAPGCRRKPRERVALACGGAVAINLPRLARKAGPWREDALFEGLADTVLAALDALQGLERFQRESCVVSDGLRERRTFALTPVGLIEALRILSDGELRPELGARLLGLLSDATRRFAAERGLFVTLSPFFGERASRRFANLDAAAQRAVQARLFEGLPVPEGESRARYASGFGLAGALASEGELEAHLFSTVRSGALFPWTSSHDGDEPARLPSVSAWRRFDAERTPHDLTSSAVDTYRRRKGAGPLFAERA